MGESRLRDMKSLEDREASSGRLCSGALVTLEIERWPSGVENLDFT